MGIDLDLAREVAQGIGAGLAFALLTLRMLEYRRKRVLFTEHRDTLAYLERQK